MFRGPFIAYLDNISFRKGKAVKKDEKPPKIVDCTFRVEPLQPDRIDELGTGIAEAVLGEGTTMRGPMRSANFSLANETYSVVFNPEAKDEGVEVLTLENGKCSHINIRRDKEADGLVGVFMVTCDLPLPKDLALLIDWTSDQHQIRFDVNQANLLTEAARESNDELPTPRLSRRKRATQPPLEELADGKTAAAGEGATA
jgi:hypothetical protein